MLQLTVDAINYKEHLLYIHTQSQETVAETVAEATVHRIFTLLQ